MAQDQKHDCETSMLVDGEMSVLRRAVKSLALTIPPIRRLYDGVLAAQAENANLRRLIQRSEYRALIHLFADNQRLSESQFTIAQTICKDVVKMVKDRDLAVGSGALDARFALPDANWSINTPNEYIQLFRRLAQCDHQDMEYFRGFTKIFTGYDLYEVRPGEGISPSNTIFDDNFDVAIANRLQERNWPFVGEWCRLTKGLPRIFVFSPPAMLGEIGHDIGGVIVNSDTCSYQERVNLLVQSGLMDWLRLRIEATGRLGYARSVAAMVRSVIG